MGRGEEGVGGKGGGTETSDTFHYSLGAFQLNAKRPGSIFLQEKLKRHLFHLRNGFTELRNINHVIVRAKCSLHQMVIE